MDDYYDEYIKAKTNKTYKSEIENCISIIAVANGMSILSYLLSGAISDRRCALRNAQKFRVTFSMIYKYVFNGERFDESNSE